MFYSFIYSCTHNFLLIIWLSLSFNRSKKRRGFISSKSCWCWCKSVINYHKQIFQGKTEIQRYSFYNCFFELSGLLVLRFFSFWFLAPSMFFEAYSFHTNSRFCCCSYFRCSNCFFLLHILSLSPSGIFVYCL